MQHQQHTNTGNARQPAAHQQNEAAVERHVSHLSAYTRPGRSTIGHPHPARACRCIPAPLILANEARDGVCARCGHLPDPAPYTSRVRDISDWLTDPAANTGIRGLAA